MSQTKKEMSRGESRNAAKRRTTISGRRGRKQRFLAAPPVLEPALLARIQQLNLDYLELLVAEHAEPECAAQLQHLPPTQRAG